MGKIKKFYSVIIDETLDDNSVFVKKAAPPDKAYLKNLNLTLGEWNSDEDEKAYKDL